MHHQPLRCGHDAEYKIRTSIKGVKENSLRMLIATERVAGVTAVGVCAQRIRDFGGATIGAGLLRTALKTEEKEEDLHTKED